MTTLTPSVIRQSCTVLYTVDTGVLLHMQHAAHAPSSVHSPASDVAVAEILYALLLGLVIITPRAAALFGGPVKHTLGIAALLEAFRTLACGPTGDVFTRWMYALVPKTLASEVSVVYAVYMWANFEIDFPAAVSVRNDLKVKVIHNSTGVLK